MVELDALKAERARPLARDDAEAPRLPLDEVHRARHRARPKREAPATHRTVPRSPSSSLIPHTTTESHLFTHWCSAPSRPAALHRSWEGPAQAACHKCTDFPAHRGPSPCGLSASTQQHCASSTESREMKTRMKVHGELELHVRAVHSCATEEGFFLENFVEVHEDWPWTAHHRECEESWRARAFAGRSEVPGRPESCRKLASTLTLPSSMM